MVLKRHVRRRTVELEHEILERKAAEKGLHLERERAQGYLDTVQTIMLALDAEGRITMINNAGLDLLGYRQEELLGRIWFTTCLPRPEGEKVYRIFLKLMADDVKSVEYNENRVLCRDGSTRLIAWHNANLTDDEGRIIGTLGSGQDITERKKMEDELRQHAEVFQYAREGIMILDAERKVVEVNDTFCEITGYGREEALGRTPRLLQSGRHDEVFYQGLYEALEYEGKWQGELWNRRKNGEVFPVWQTITVVRGEEGEVQQYISIFSDISEKKMAEERIRHLAHYDALTDLPNRFLFEERCSRALARAQRNDSKVAVLFLDLDRFKVINDTLGHAVGDVVLQQVAERLVDNLREDDTVARLGGDEFVVILESGEPQTDAATVSDKLIAVLNEPFEVAGEQLHIGASIGVSIFPDNGKTVPELVKQADVAMYRAKDSGRNNYGFFAA
jgi:diguanylate cyclase (GGDEF)-like protein/PAS domain S-box-containing protein